MIIFERKKAAAFFHSLRVQLMLYFIAVCIVVLAVGSYLSYRTMFGMLQKRNEELVSQQFTQAEQNITNLLEEVDRLAGVYLLKDDVQNFIQTTNRPYVYENVEMVRNMQKMADDIILNYPFIDSIYLFTQNKEAIGISKDYTLTVRQGQEELPFFKTDMYKKVETDKNRSLWYGGYKRSFFNDAFKQDPDSDGFLITQVKGVRAVKNQTKSGILVFNIDEQSLFSLFGTLGNDSVGTAYIVDGSGRIISSGDGKIIGAPCTYFDRIDKSKNYGSITLNGGNGGKSTRQRIYYKLKSLDWYIIRDVPLRIDSEYTAYLQKTFIAVLLFSIFAILLASYFWLKKITRPLDRLVEKMVGMSQGNLGLTMKSIPKNELGVVIKSYNEMTTSIDSLIRENKLMEEQKRKLEIETLQSQINPHFLYNTLNMIKWMAAVINAKNIVESIVVLGNLLVPVFKDTETMCTLKDEIDYVSNYIKIMNWRYGNGITFSIQMPDEFNGYKVPKFILQPLLENSMTHGLQNEHGLISICIMIEEMGGDLIISVKDTGAGIPEEKLDEINRMLTDLNAENYTFEGGQSHGIGICNVNKRIRLYYGEGYGLNFICPPEGGTIALLRISKFS